MVIYYIFVGVCSLLFTFGNSELSDITHDGFCGLYNGQVSIRLSILNFHNLYYLKLNVTLSNRYVKIIYGETQCGITFLTKVVC